MGSGMSLQKKEILSIIEPQLSSDGRGIQWFRTLTPAHAAESEPFFALEVFRAGESEVVTPNPIPRELRNVSLFTYLIHGKYSLRVDNELVKQATSGDFILLNSGKSTFLEEVFLPEYGMLEGFRLWVKQNHHQRATNSILINPDSPKIYLDQKAIQIQVLLGKANFKDQEVEIPDINLLNVSLHTNSTFKWKVPPHQNVMVFVFQGRAFFGPYRGEDQVLISRHQVLLYGKGEELLVQTQDTPVRFLIATGRTTIASN
jgi:redox-sensitive bicupin YhaK (pirin superfamily)